MRSLNSKGVKALRAKLWRNVVSPVRVALGSANPASSRADAEGLSFEEAARLCGEVGDASNLRLTPSEDLRGIAQAAYRAHQLPLARQAIAELIARGEATAPVHLDLGMIELRDGNVEAALACFQTSIALDPGFAPPWMESAAAKRRLKRWDGVLVECLAFVERNAEPIPKVHGRLLRSVADSTFEAGDRISAGRLYAALKAHGEEADDLGARWGEALLAMGEGARAYEALRPLHDEGKLGNSALLSFVGACTQAGRPAEADAAFARIDRSALEGPQLAQFLRLHYLRGDFAGARAFLDSIGPKLPDKARLKLLFEYHVKAGQFDAAFDQMENGSVGVGDFDKHFFIEFGYRLLSAKEHDGLGRLLSLLAAEHGPDEHVLALRMSALFARQDWDGAAEAAAAIPGELLAGSRVLKLRCLELAAFRRDFDEARALLDDLGPADALPRNFLPSIARFHAETKNWRAVVDLLPLLLAPDFDYEAAAGDVIVRACRQAGAQGEVVALIEGLAGWTGSKGLKKLRAILLEDGAGNEDAVLSLLADPHVVEFTWAKQRLIQKSVALRAKAPSEGAGVREKHTVFFCTNAAYLCGTAVSLYSLLRANQSALDRFDVHVVLDDDVRERGAAVFRDLGRAFGTTVQAVGASEVVGSLEGLSGEYGLFTGGHTLAPAAFYRIFFARYARAVLKRRRGLYIDSDTIVSGPIEGLFEAGYAAPLLARREVERPEVRRAINAHGLVSGEYFNSGVLLFDFAAEGFERLIDRTVATIHDETVTLLFHDQCALNIGFDGVIEPLDPRYNCFVDVGADPAMLEAGNAILHFLDRPKPWDASYDGPASAYWFKHWRELASIVGGGVALDLLSSAQ